MVEPMTPDERARLALAALRVRITDERNAANHVAANAKRQWQRTAAAVRAGAFDECLDIITEVFGK